MRKALRTSILLLSLSVSAHAGEIPFGITGNPSGGTQPRGATVSEDAASQPEDLSITGIALSLLQSVLAVF